MKTHHPDNERAKRRYLDYLREANGLSEASLDAAAKALSRFEAYTKHRDFRAFRPEQAKGFKAQLVTQANARTGERLSKATSSSTLRSLKAFFKWLAGQPGYRSKLNYSDADYFNPSANDARTAKARRETAVPSLEQIAHVLACMPAGSDIERRNQALVAFTILTGARDGAMISLRLKHVSIEQGKVIQDPREVDTKGRKGFTTWFFPVGEEPLRIVREWVEHLRETLLWSPDDPLFPQTRIAVGKGGAFEAVGLRRTGWSNAAAIRKVFREAFSAAGLPYFNPHSFRNTLAQIGERICPNPEAFKAWSQNLGHEDVLTTFRSYGEVAQTRQAEVIRSLGLAPPQDGQSMQRLQAFIQAEAARISESRVLGPRDRPGDPASPASP